MKIERKDGNSYIYKEAGKRLRILQLTDVHLGCGLFCRRNDNLALEAVDKLVQASEADFCIITGDMGYPFITLGGSHDNRKPITLLNAIFERHGMPWCAVFGNHDTEPHADRQKADG